MKPVETGHQSLQLLTVKEASDLLRYAPSTLRKKLKSGEVRGVRFAAGGDWRIPAATIRALLNGCGQETAA